MKKTAFLIIAMPMLLSAGRGLYGQVMLDSGWYHVRNAGPREWSAYPEKARLSKHSIIFPFTANAADYTLSIRQYDVKQPWRITLNNKVLGHLTTDEKDMITYVSIPAGALHANNELEISCDDLQPDDIQIGNILIYDRPVGDLLSEAHISLELRNEAQELMPGRITVVNARGILQPVSGSNMNSLAVRTGHVYSGDGKATLGLPAGTYVLYAGRGFEYGIDSARVELKAGDHAVQKFSIQREVSTSGWVSSDTHIHTYTWSGHGDASAAERAITIAGEGIELPVLTDHNLHADLKPFAMAHAVDRYFTPVMGNEVTTNVGHFNLFPVSATERVVRSRANNWKTLSNNLKPGAKGKAIILNHGRDVHTNFRPFAPEKHLSVAGARLDYWDFPANAMEVMNSGSQQSEPLQLTHDWFGLLNHGESITPVGSSDSHDVSRYIVGQARTYIRCNDDDPGKINVDDAVNNFLAGNVMVSFGLLASIEVNGAYGPGELVPASDEVDVSVTVSGPAWTDAERIELYANGKKIREEIISGRGNAGVKWNGEWQLTLPTYDIFLVALATGPGKGSPFWPIAKPYQPASPDWRPIVMGLSGAVWVDGDRNGKRNSANDYARHLYKEAGDDINLLIKNLSAFDDAVAVQVAAILHQSGKDLNSADVAKALQKATPETRASFKSVILGLASAR